jgi:hypothetical protein
MLVLSAVSILWHLLHPWLCTLKVLWNVNKFQSILIIIYLRISCSIYLVTEYMNSEIELSTIKYVESEFLIAVVIKSSFFWDIMPCSPLKVNWLDFQQTTWPYIPGYRPLSTTKFTWSKISSLLQIYELYKKRRIIRINIPANYSNYWRKCSSSKITSNSLTLQFTCH